MNGKNRVRFTKKTLTVILISAAILMICFAILQLWNSVKIIQASIFIFICYSLLREFVFFAEKVQYQIMKTIKTENGLKIYLPNKIIYSEVNKHF